MNRKLISVLTAAGLGAALALGGVAVPAQAAQTWDPYCQAHVYDGTPYGTTFTRASQCRVQGGPARLTNQAYTYAGVVDGHMGPNSWKGLQAYLAKHHGYTGPVDGVPGTNTYKAMQRWAALSGGYGGPIDGVMGDNSWAGFNRAVRVSFFSD